MWLFLLTEIMFFGGMFFAYLLYRNWYYDAFVSASNQLSVPLGTLNTIILITSGFFMALGVYFAEVRNRKMLVGSLILTTVFGLAFLGVKGVEYHEKWEKHHVPGADFNVKEFINPRSVRSGGEAAGTRYGAEDAGIFLSVFRDDRHACHPHDYRYCDSVLVDVEGTARRVFDWVCRSHRELWTLLALCRYCVVVSVSFALPDQPSSLGALTALGLEELPVSDTNDALNVTNPEHSEIHIVTPLQYSYVYGTLLVGTILTVLAAKVELGVFNPIVALGIACFKATVVILFFMHVKYQSRLIKITVGAGFFTFIVLITMTLSDYMSRAWGLW